MARVHILKTEIVSKIAAGEVIERPASVVKELLENSIDAKADSIEVQLKNAGKTLIQIKDNGEGIDKDDLEKIFLRHATSKIKNADDLYSINSLGFRGEALYSIAAISDVNLQTKTKNEDSGWEIHVRGVEKLNLRPVTMGSTGTIIEINELFYNTPARKKFLKSNTTELHKILSIFIPYTLLHNNIRFKFSHQDKDLIDLQPNESLKSRIAQTLNLDEKYLIERNQEFPNKKLSVKMILGDINIKRSRRDMQFVFINNRPVQSKSVSFQLNQVYRLIMPPGDVPFFCVYINIPAEDIDANIHPTKREVKIKDEQTLAPIIRNMCEAALMTSGNTKQVKISVEGKHVNTVIVDTVTADKALSKSSLQQTMFDSSPSDEVAISDKYKTSSQRPTDQHSFPETGIYFKAAEELLDKKQDNLQNKLSNSRYIGSFINKYLLFETNKSILLVDQHAAQERITFEQLIIQMQKGNVQAQHLLSPILIKLSPGEIIVWEDAKERLESIGFSSTQFDNQTLAIHTYPVLIKDVEKAVREILSGGDVAKCDHETLARRACRSSIMTGDRLSPQQAEFQREQLLQCLNPFTCPHGRPTVVEMTTDFMDKQFLRS